MDDKLLNQNKKQFDEATLFIILVIGLNALFWLIMLVTRCKNIDSYFLPDHYATGMDYFNMLYSVKSLKPYQNNESYPALCFLILAVIFHWLPDSTEVNYEDWEGLRDDMLAQLTYFLFLLICLVVIWELTRFVVNGKEIKKIGFSFAFLTSGPMMYLFERGNILFVSLACTMAFLILYESEHFWVRQVSYFLLAVAAGIKIYPAAFALLILQKRRIKGLFALAIVGIFVFFVPFFAFDGIQSIKDMINGLVGSVDLQTNWGLGLNYSFENLVKIGAAFLGINLASVPSIYLGLFVAGCLIMFVIATEEWQRLFAIVLLCIGIPGYSYTYVLTFLILPILSFFFRREKESRFKWIYSVLFSLTMVMYALPYVEKIYALFGGAFYHVSYGQLIIYDALILISILVFVESISERISKKSLEKKDEKDNFSNDSDI